MKLNLHDLSQKIGIVTILLLSFVGAKGQQIPIFTQYQHFHSFINPASVPNEFLAYDYRLQAAASYRHQWADHPYSPKTTLINADFMTSEDKDFGLIIGANFLGDDAGPTSFNGFYGRVATMVGDLDNWAIAVGLNFGYVQHQFNTEDITFIEDGDLAAQTNINQGVLDVGGGLYFYKMMGMSDAPSIIYAGVSVPQMGFDVSYRVNNDFFSINRERHYYGLVGFFKKMEDGSFIEVNGWAKYLPRVPFNADLNVRYQFKVPFWIGVGGSTAQSTHFEAGLSIGNLIGNEDSDIKIGYSIDRYFNDIGPNFGLTHEINLAWLLNTGGGFVDDE